MGEIAVRANATPTYEVDDVVTSYSDIQIALTNAQRICFEQTPGRSLKGAVRGLLPLNSPAHFYLTMTSELEFQRLSRSRAQVTRMSDGNVIEFDSNVPFVQHNGQTGYMDIVEVVKRRTASKQFPVFGPAGLERWYGGTISYDDTSVGSIWDFIEAETRESREDDLNKHWPFGKEELRRYLILRTVPITDEEAAGILEPLFVTVDGKFRWDKVNPDNSVTTVFADEVPDGNGEWTNVIDKARRNKLLDATTLLASVGLTRDELQDHSVSIDKRREITPLLKTNVFHDKATGGIRSEIRPESGRIGGAT